MVVEASSTLLHRICSQTNERDASHQTLTSADEKEDVGSPKKTDANLLRREHHQIDRNEDTRHHAMTKNRQQAEAKRLEHGGN